MNKLPIIIDCDPGIDDALALIYAFSKDNFDIKAIHTVSGNVSVDYTTNNARAILGLIDRTDIAVYAGSKQPLVNKPIYADDIHGKQGLGGVTIAEELYAPQQEMTAYDSYVNILKNTEDKLTIVAIGPLTNIAILLKAHPEFSQKIEKIAIMGGGIDRGNTTAAAEFNFYADPHAAKIVSESGIPIVLAGLNVTENARLYESDMEEIKGQNQKLSQFLLDLNTANIDFVEKTYNRGRYTTPHDVMPFMYLIEPGIFKTEEMAIIVEANDGPTKGMSYRDLHRHKNENNMTVITGVDNDRYKEELLSSILKMTLKN